MYSGNNQGGIPQAYSRYVPYNPSLPTNSPYAPPVPTPQQSLPTNLPPYNPPTNQATILTAHNTGGNSLAPSLNIGINQPPPPIVETALPNNALSPRTGLQNSSIIHPTPLSNPPPPTISGIPQQGSVSFPSALPAIITNQPPNIVNVFDPATDCDVTTLDASSSSVL